MKYIKAHLRIVSGSPSLVPGHFRREALPDYRTSHQRKRAVIKGKARRVQKNEDG